MNAKLSALIVLLALSTTLFAYTGPDHKVQANLTQATKQGSNGYAFFLEVPNGKSVVITFSLNAGGEVAGLVHKEPTSRRAHRAGNHDSRSIKTLHSPSYTAKGPGKYWITCWFKQPGWVAGRGWQQQRMKILADTSTSVRLGCEDRWGNPGTGGSEDWNDLVVSFSKP